MSDSLRFFKGFSDGSFFINVKERFTEYYEFCERYYEEGWHDKKKKTTFFSKAVPERFSQHANKVEVKSDTNYTEECYYLRELAFLNEVEHTIQGLLGEAKITDYVKILVNKIQLLIDQIEEVKYDGGLQQIKNTIVLKLTLLNKQLTDSYLGNGNHINTNPKIRWKTDLKVLTTLFFELLHGQEKGRGNNRFTTPSFIEAEKKDLQELLLNNFLDSEGNPLKPHTINDYLNKSKKNTRSPEGERLEFPVK